MSGLEEDHIRRVEESAIEPARPVIDPQHIWTERFTPYVTHFGPSTGDDSCAELRAAAITSSRSST
jgi:hypothetical protein